MRLLYVLLDNVAYLLWVNSVFFKQMILFLVGGNFKNVLKISGQENSFSLRKAIGLNNIGSLLLTATLVVLCKVVSKVVNFIRNDPRLWKEIILLWKHFVHAHQVPRQ